MKRYHLLVSGKVQGVFFRASTKRKALALGLKGFVRNLSDGKVEIVVEGSNPKIKELIEFWKKKFNVSDIEMEEENFKEEFKGFEIKCM